MTPFTNSAVWFNKGAFTQPATGTYGTQLRNTLRGPGYWSWDMGLRKNFKVYEAQTLQFRFEMFDILESSQLEQSGDGLTPVGRSGLVTGKSNDARNMQLALNTALKKRETNE